MTAKYLFDPAATNQVTESGVSQPERGTRKDATQVGPSDECKKMAAGPASAAIEQWNRLITPALPKQPQSATDDAISRVLLTREGAALVSKSGALFCRNGACYPKIRIAFTDQIEGRDTDGQFEPEDFYPADPDPEVYDMAALKAFVYKVKIRPIPDREFTSLNSFPGGPQDKTSCNIYYRFSQGSSEMAATIYHELLHIWYINHYQTSDTGHDDGHSCLNYRKEFLEKLRVLYGELDRVEACLRSIQKK